VRHPSVARPREYRVTIGVECGIAEVTMAID